MAVLRLCVSHYLDMTRPQRIAITAFLSALFVPFMFLIPVWCLRSEGMKVLVWGVSGWAPQLVTSLMTLAIPLLAFAIPCALFAWVIARIWR